MLRLARPPAESRTTGKHRRKERGQSLIEFAVTAPMLLVLLLGLVEMGHAFNSYMTVVAAARDAARLGAQIGDGDIESDATDQATLTTLVQNEIARLENAPIPNTCADPGICITHGIKEADVDEWVQVKVCYEHSMIVGVPGIGDGPINMCSQTRIRLANP
jgi:hypothetical protein